MINSLAVMREHLGNQATITALVGKRVMVTPLAEGAGTLPAIEFRRVGGPGRNPEIPDEVTPLFEFRCWGGDRRDTASLDNAFALDAALNDVLIEIAQKRVSVPQFTIDSVVYGPFDLSLGEELEAGTDFLDLDSEAHFVRSAWRVRVSTNS